MNIFDASGYMPRFSCIHGNKVLAWLYAIPNIHTFLTYSIGFVLIYQMLRKKAVVSKLPFFPTLMWLTPAFSSSVAGRIFGMQWRCGIQPIDFSWFGNGFSPLSRFLLSSTPFRSSKNIFTQGQRGKKSFSGSKWNTFRS